MTTPGVVGRARELELLRAAVTAGRDVLLEGPPGTSKTTMLRAITADWGVPLMFVEGNADLTTGKLVGHHAPDRVLREGYLAENFVDGPLVEAMRLGGFLYIEELNRSPQDTLNTLLSAIGDRRLTIPRIGTITAKSTFRLIASMNPFDNVGTMRISMSIYDRLCRLAVGYQDEALEREIVEQRTSSDGDPLQRDDRLVRDAVALVRATRDHPDVRHGSSVRGAIDTVLVARELGRARQVIVDLPGTVRRPGEAYRALVLDAITVALSGRIQLDPTAVMTAEQVLHDIWESYFLSLAAASGGENAVVADSPLRRDRPGDPNAPFRRKPKTLDEPPTLFVPSPNGQDGGVALRSAGPLLAPPPARPDDRTAPSQSDDEGELQPLDEGAADTEVARRAHEIASRLALVRHRDRRPRSGGRGVLQSAPFDGGSDEIDLDATMDALLETPDIAAEDVVVRTRLLHPRAVALIVDISGSMRGERVRTAAATVGALAGEMEDDQFGGRRVLVGRGIAAPARRTCRAGHADGDTAPPPRSWPHQRRLPARDRRQGTGGRPYDADTGHPPLGLRPQCGRGPRPSGLRVGPARHPPRCERRARRPAGKRVGPGRSGPFLPRPDPSGRCPGIGRDLRRLRRPTDTPQARFRSWGRCRFPPSAPGPGVLR